MSGGVRASRPAAALAFVVAAALACGPQPRGEAPNRLRDRGPITGARSGSPSIDSTGLDGDAETDADEFQRRGQFRGVLVPAAEIILSADKSARLLRLDLDVGDHFSADQVIAELDADDERSEVETAAAVWRASVAELEELELELERARTKREDTEQLRDYVSQAELRERQHAEALAAARRRRAEASLGAHRSSIARAKTRLAESELRAPFAGSVAERYVDPGAMIVAGEPIVRLLTDARLVRFAVPEAAAGRLRLGAPVLVSFTDSDPVLAGVVTMLAPEVDVATRLILAEASLTDPAAVQSLRVGSSVSVRFTDEQR